MHMRSQIRERFKSVLDAALGPTYDVYSSRKYAINVKPGVALVDMRFLNDQTQEREVMSDARVHVASLYIRVQRPASENGIDDALDADQLAVTLAVEAEDWSDMLEEDPELLQVNFSDSAEGQQVVAAIVIRYDVEYRVNKFDPETRIE